MRIDVAKDAALLLEEICKAGGARELGVDLEAGLKALFQLLAGDSEARRREVVQMAVNTPRCQKGCVE